MSYKYLFKLVVVGSGNVGKSAIVGRFVDNRFLPAYNATIGVDFSSRLLNLNNREQIKLQIWDTAGQENFAAIIRSYYRGVAGIVLVYDISNRSSFEKLNYWLKEINENKDSNDPIPIIIVANKLDIRYRTVTREEGESFALNKGLIYIEASAKQGINIEKIFKVLCRNIYNNLLQGHTTGTKVHPTEDTKRLQDLQKCKEVSSYSCCGIC